MCGIAGQFNFHRGEPVARETIVRMADSIAHRGPDDEGYFISGALGLGFRRLSIIDLAGGHQPMSDAGETVWVIFNGEIYNFKELRTELQQRGHQFRTNCDTEVIIHGYKEWGTHVFDHLNGMFGLAIWDVANQRLVVARDAMGIKLIYYRLTDGQLTFGSEIRALSAAGHSPPEVDPIALNLFLRFRYTPSPLTIFQDVRKLAPGTMLIAEKGQCHEEAWYTYTPKPFANAKEDKEATDELLQLYKDAVRRHLLSDVPVGILLSGGLDSGLLLALMNEHGRNWPAYTVGYGEGFEDDELVDAAETASLFGARHIPVKLDRAEFEQSLPKIVASLEEPIASSSIVPMYFVSQRAREDVKVALIGQGPDEVFAGYKRHFGVHYGSAWRGLPSPIRKLLGSAVQRLPRNEMAKRGIQSLSTKERLQRYQHVFSLAPAAKIRGLFRDGLLPGPVHGDLVANWSSLRPQMQNLDELGGFQMLEVRSSLPDELLMFGDKLSMAHSLEVRVPYLDRTVVEFAQRLDSSFKMRHGTGKWLHRRVCQQYLPPQLLKRKKRGFAVNVVDGWFNSSVEGKLGELLTDEQSLIFDFLKPAKVRQLLKEHRASRHDNHKLLFSLVMFEQWLRQTRVGSGAERNVVVAEVSQALSCMQVASANAPLEVFQRETLIKGQRAQQQCITIAGQTYSIKRGLVTLVSLEDEWYEDVREPELVIEALERDRRVKADIFGFGQRVPNSVPAYQYPMESESVAVLPIQTFDNWWNKQIGSATRNMVRKSQKAGVEVRECKFDDPFVMGMTEIFNETPLRQGRRFWHFGKDLATVRQQFSRFLYREFLVAAYCGNEMVGFAIVADAGPFAVLVQIISKLQHRNRAINNALLAKAVDICAQKQLAYLVYGFWTATSLVNFKRHSGFEEMRLPRYFVPLTAKGRIALKLGIHRGWNAAIPDRVKNPLKEMRRVWYEKRHSTRV